MRKFIALFTLLSVLVPLPTAAAFDQAAAVNYLKSGPLGDWEIMALSASQSLAGVDLSLLQTDPGNIPTDIERRILATMAAGVDPASLTDRLASYYNGTEINTPGDPTLLSDDIFGLLALAGAKKRTDIQTQLNENPGELKARRGSFFSLVIPDKKRN